MEQLTLFDLFPMKQFKIDKPIRLIELFGGIGSQAMALRNLGADFEHYRMVEVDKYAVASYNAIHDTEFVPTDITEVHGRDLGITDTDKYCYILTYSFPCQDLSVAGKMKGMKEGTRSGLLWEVERLLTEVEEKPQVLLMENVPQVHGKKNIEDFNRWLGFLESQGYTNYWQDINAKDYGIPQSRNRCFCVSLLGQYLYKFGQPIPLPKIMADMLEDNVEEKYYITSDRAKVLVDKLIQDATILDRQTDRQTDRQWTQLSLIQDQQLSQTASVQHNEMSLQERERATVSVNGLGYIEKGTGRHQSNMVYGSDGIIPCQYATQWKSPLKILDIDKC